MLGFHPFISEMDILKQVDACIVISHHKLGARHGLEGIRFCSVYTTANGEQSIDS